MLPPGIIDQITSLNAQRRDLNLIINRLSRTSETQSQVDLDRLAAKIKASFAEADRGIEVRIRK